MSIITPPQTIIEEIRGTTLYYDDTIAFALNQPTYTADRSLWQFRVTDVKINNKSNILYIPRGTQNVNLTFNYYSIIKSLHPNNPPYIVGNLPLLLNISWYIGPVTNQVETPILSRAMNTIYDNGNNYWLRDLIFVTVDEPFSGTINIPETFPGDVYYITHTYDYNSVPSGTKQFSTNSQPIATIILMDPIFDTLPTRTIYDDTEAGTIVYKININDSFHQNYTNFKIEYSLIEIEDYLSFIIDLATGDVLLLKPQLSRVKSSYTFSINANIIGTYKGAFINYDEILQSIVINNISRQSSGDGTTIVPYFTDILYNIQLDDTIQAENLIYKFIAVSPENNKLRYDVIGDDSQLFNIDINNGSLTFKNLPNKLYYKIKIKVTDLINSENVISDNITIKINNVSYFIGGENIIINIDDTYPDNSLIYTSKLMYKSVLEGTPSYSYSINPGDDASYFTITINQGQGQIYIKKTPNFDNKSTYKFQIEGDIELRTSDMILVSYPFQNITVNVFQTNKFDSCSHTPPDPPNLWSRATLSCVDYDVYSQEEFAMRQKAEVLKYKGNKNPLTKKQQFSRNVNGNGPLGKKVWATQNDLGSNPNVFNLPQIGNTLILCPNNDKYFAYVANGNGSNVSAYMINPTTGALTKITGSPFLAGGGPESVTVDPTGKFAYVANNYTNNVSAYTINPTTGALTEITGAGSPFLAGAGPTSVTVDPTGKFAYVANYNSSNVSAYTINPATGALTEITGSPFLAGGGALSLTVDPTGKFAYVANNVSSNVSAYTINPATGALTEITGSPFLAGGGPYSVKVDPTGKFAYVANGNDSNVSAYTINPTTGALTEITGSPFLAGGGPESVTVDPSGKFAYVANGNDSNVSAYTINPATGALTVITGSPFPSGQGPVSVTVDPSGKFAYVTNRDNNSVSAYTINPATGALTEITGAGSPFPARQSPVSVTTTRILGNTNNIKCAPSSSSDVPGNSVLCYNPAVPLVNYLPPPRTYLAGGTKWPLSTWKPGDNGFPRGKKGSMNMLFQ